MIFGSQKPCRLVCRIVLRAAARRLCSSSNQLENVLIVAEPGDYFPHAVLGAMEPVGGLFKRSREYR
jgi:hypothetical protein